MKIKSCVVLALLIITCSGCMSTVDNLVGVGKITNSTSEFDGAKVIELSKSRNFSANGKANTWFGARWSDSNPDYVSLKLIFSSDSSSGDAFTSFNEIRVNINGDIDVFEVPGKTYRSRSDYNDVSKVIYTTSVAYVPLELSYLERMIEAESCKVQVSSSDGYEDISFDIETYAGSETSKARLREFVAAVKR